MKMRVKAFQVGLRRRSGQALVEFALILPLLLTMILGIIEFSWLAKNFITMANAAREGARTASVGWPTASASDRVETLAAPLNVNVTLEVSTDEGQTWNTLVDSGGMNAAGGGQMIRVQVEATHRQLSGFFPFLNQMQLREEAVMRREPN